jgi:hypothetical protein
LSIPSHVVVLDEPTLKGKEQKVSGNFINCSSTADRSVPNFHQNNFTF